MEKIKLRITAKSDNQRKFAVIFMGEKIAVAFGRDSGARVGYKTRMISGDIKSGGSKINWFCEVKKDSVFELEVDKEFYDKNKNRIKKWGIEEIAEFSVSKQRSDEALAVQQNLE